MATKRTTSAAKKKSGDLQRVGRVRMSDIARLVGVSRPVVSRVLTGAGLGHVRVSAKTAAKIRREAKRLNFHPNHAARQLAGKRSGVVGTLAKTWFRQTESRLLGWLNQLASCRGFKILAWQMDAHPNALEESVDECLAWDIEGLIFMAFKYDTVWPEVAKALVRLPRVVSILGNPGIPGGYAVEVDAADGVRQSVERLHRQGRRKIVQVLEGLDAQIDRQRHDAFLAAHREFYGEVRKDQVCFATRGWAVDDYDKHLELCKELVRDRKADAVLLESDFCAPGMVRGFTRLGCRIPDDVALVGWGNEALGWGVIPPLTTVDFNFSEIVGKALDLLNDLIEKPGAEHPRSVLVKPNLIVRETA